MSDKELVETVYSKHHKYEIYRKSGGVFGSPTYQIYRDGKPHLGSFSSLKDAVERARKEP